MTTRSESQSIAPPAQSLFLVSGQEPSVNRPYLSVILPVHNEEAMIEQMVTSLDRLLTERLPGGYEILVVDDGSTDQSATRIRQVESATIRFCQHPYNIGNGAAIKTGIRHATGRYLLMLDADGQHPVAEIPRLLACAEQYDMVVAARTRASQSDWHRDLANAIYNVFASYICGLPIRDLTSGFRLVKTELAKSFIYLLPNTFSYPATLTLAVLRDGHSVTYVPYAAKRRVGKSKINLWVDGARFFTILFRIAVFFSPLKVFIPISLFFFVTGFLWYLYRVFWAGLGFPPISSLLMTTSVVIFLIGLVSEQITYLRYRQP